MKRVGIVISLFVTTAWLFTCGCETLIGADFGEKKLRNVECPQNGELLPDAGGGPDLLFAMSGLDLGDSVDGGVLVGAQYGVPVEDVGTCGDPTGAQWPLVETPPVNGRVSAFAAAAVELNEQIGQLTTSAAASATMRNGTRSTLLLVRDYVPGVDKDPVTVHIFSGTTLTRSATSSSGTSSIPEWEGEDVWHPIGDNNGCVQTITASGSITGDVLELHDADAPYLLHMRELRAKIEPAGSTFRMGGTASGTVTIQTVFLALGERPEFCADQPFFLGTATRVGLKQIWCERRDTDLDGNMQCDALSGGFAFEATAAILSREVAKGPVRCDSDPANETCE